MINDQIIYLYQEAIKTLEKYKKVFDSKLNILNEYEFNDIVTLDNVIGVLQRAEMVMKIVEEIQRQIYELGDDGRLVKMQLSDMRGWDSESQNLVGYSDMSTNCYSLKGWNLYVMKQDAESVKANSDKIKAFINREEVKEEKDETKEQETKENRN